MASTARPPSVPAGTKVAHPMLAKGKAIFEAMRGRQPEGAIAGDGPSVIKTTAAFMRNNVSPLMNMWRPAFRDTQEDVQASWAQATARATDVVQNSGWVSGGIRSAIGNIVGDGLRLTATPDTTVIKFDGLVDDQGQPIDADGWARFVERRWEAWSNAPRECDALARQTINQMAISTLKLWFVTGEMVALLPYHKDNTAATGTKVLCMAPWKLSQKNDAFNRIVQGVEMDERGRPWAYLFRRKDNMGVERDVAIRAYDDAGRPQVVHLYEGTPGQVRGITPLVSVLQVCRQFDQLANATLMAALIQAIFAATIESDAPTTDLMAALQTSDEQQGLGGSLEDFLAAKMGWNANTTIDLSEQGRVAHLFPGEKLKFNRSEHPNGTYEAFVKVLLRELAKGLGTTVEQVTGDYSGVTYTGVRMGTTDNWQTTLDRRNNLMARWYQGPYEAWLEEEIERGIIKFPGGIANFMAHRAEACRAKWRGPAKPQADDLKSQKAHQGYREMGTMSDTMIADDLGVRIEDVYEQRRREKALRVKFGLDDVGPSVQVAVAQISADAAAKRAEDAAEEADMLKDDPAEEAA